MTDKITHLRAVQAEAQATDNITQAVHDLNRARDGLGEALKLKSKTIPTPMPHHVDMLKSLLHAAWHSQVMAYTAIRAMKPADVVAFRQSLQDLHNMSCVLCEQVNIKHGRLTQFPHLTADGDLLPFHEFPTAPKAS